MPRERTRADRDDYVMDRIDSAHDQFDFSNTGSGRSKEGDDDLSDSRSTMDRVRDGLACTIRESEITLRLDQDGPSAEIKIEPADCWDFW